MTKRNENSTRQPKRPLETVKCSACSKERKVKHAIAEFYRNRATPYRCKECAEKNAPKQEKSSRWGGHDIILTCSGCGKTRTLRPYLAVKIAKPYQCRVCFSKNIGQGQSHPSYKPEIHMICKCTSCGKEKQIEKRIFERYSKPYRCTSCNAIKGEKNFCWKGGVSQEEYSAEWTRNLREAIRERDNRECQVCQDKQPGRVLSVHHIDYDKKNLDETNLITLCMKCHAKTTHHREHWQARLTKQIAEKYK